MEIYSVTTEHGIFQIPSNPRDDWKASTWGFWTYLNARAIDRSGKVVTKYHDTDGYLLDETITSCFTELWGHIPWLNVGRNDYQTMMIKLKASGHIVLQERTRPRINPDGSKTPGASIWWIAAKYQNPAPVHKKPKPPKPPKTPAEKVLSKIKPSTVQPEQRNVLTEIMHDVQLSKVGSQPTPLPARVLPATLAEVQSPATLDLEIEAMGLITAILNRLQEAQRRRVIHYLQDRF